MTNIPTSKSIRTNYYTVLVQFYPATTNTVTVDYQGLVVVGMKLEWDVNASPSTMHGYCLDSLDCLCPTSPQILLPIKHMFGLDCHGDTSFNGQQHTILIEAHHNPSFTLGSIFPFPIHNCKNRDAKIVSQPIPLVQLH